MTTVYKHNLFMLSFQGRSPRQIYKEACEERHVYVQDALVEVLSNTPDDFGKLQHLLCSDIAFGPKGCMALVPIIQVSHHLRRVDLKGCGLTDEFLVHLVDGLQEHPTIRTIDLSNNPFITVNSGKALVKMVELNPNIVVCALDGTHVGRNVAKVVTSRCEVNRHRLMSYFCDDFFKMKDLFNSVDADGSGWVHIKNIVGSIPAPILQERMIERIALKRPKKRQDNCIHVNTFLELVYLNYKTLPEINERYNDKTDSSYAVIRTNWRHILAALSKHHVTCSRLDKFRPREIELMGVEAEELVDLALTLHHHQGAPSTGVTPSTTPPPPPEHPPAAASAPANNSGADKKIDLNVQYLFAAFKHKFPPMPHQPKVFGFLKERPDDYISPLLRSGSRCVSITDMSSTGGTPALSALGEGDDDPPHTWKLPPAMVCEIVKLFGNHRDILIDDLLEVTLETELEKLRMSGLASKFAEISLPTDITSFSLQEVVNMLDEYYDVLRVDKKFEFDDIKKMCS